MVIYERVYNNLYGFWSLEKGERHNCQELRVDFVKICIFWYVNSEKGVIE